MKKVWLRCAVALVLLSSFVFFSFTAAAEAPGLSFYPIPQLYTNWNYGQNLSWLTMDHVSEATLRGSSYTMTNTVRGIWNYFLPSSANIQAIDEYQWTVAPATNDSMATFAIDFEGVNNGNAIFDLSSIGYAQFWFEFMVDGRRDQGLYNPNIPDVDIYIVGNRTRSGAEGNLITNILEDMEYIHFGYGSGSTDTLLPVNSAGLDSIPSSDFSHSYVGLCGATVTHSAMRSTSIRYIVFRIRYPKYQNQYVNNGRLWLSRINYRRYDGAGESLDSSSAPSLDPNSKAEADLEADIQNSIAKGNDLINNRINSMEQSLNASIQDMTDDDMGYESPDTSESRSVLQQLTQFQNNLKPLIQNQDQMYTSAMESVSDTLNDLHDYLYAVYDNVPVLFRGALTAMMVFLVSRKVVGR